MPDPLSPGHDQLQADVELAWSYAVNADLGADPKAATDPAGRQRALQARADRHARYARGLLHALGADPDRLRAVAAACRAEHARQVADGHAAEGGHATAARLAELVLEDLRRTQADAGPAGRHRLIAELDQAAPVNLSEAESFGNHCVVVGSSFGSLIHTAVGSAGGWGGLRTKRSGCWA